MIMDKLEHFRYYQRCVPELWDAVRFVERVEKERLPAGRYPVGKGFAFVQEGQTRSFEEADFETHDKYLDVQILLEGSEMWEYADKADLTVKTPYDPDTDIELLLGLVLTALEEQAVKPLAQIVGNYLCSDRSERERPLYCTGQAEMRHQGAAELQQA